MNKSEKIGPFTAVDAYKSFTDVRAFKVVDDVNNPSIIKIIRNDKDGNNLKQMQHGVEMTDYLAGKGVEIPAMLPVHGGKYSKLFVGEDIVMTKRIRGSRKAIK